MEPDAPTSVPWHPLGMNTRPPSVSDEVRGLRAVGSLVGGDVDGALAELEQTSFSYLAGLLPRLAFVAASVAARLAWSMEACPAPVAGGSPVNAAPELCRM